MLHLLTIPTDYWSRFITIDTTTDTDSQKISGYSYFGKIVQLKEHFRVHFQLNVLNWILKTFELNVIELFSISGTPNARIADTTIRKERNFFATPPTYNTTSRRWNNRIWRRYIVKKVYLIFSIFVLLRLNIYHIISVMYVWYMDHGYLCTLYMTVLISLYKKSFVLWNSKKKQHKYFCLKSPIDTNIRKYIKNLIFKKKLKINLL